MGITVTDPYTGRTTGLLGPRGTYGRVKERGKEGGGKERRADIKGPVVTCRTKEDPRTRHKVSAQRHRLKFRVVVCQ